MTRLLPGVAFAATVGLCAAAVANIETRYLGHPVVEGLVVAILLGMLVRTCRTLPPSLDDGVAFTAKQVLELAVLMLGASVDLPLLLRAGRALAVSIVALVIVGLTISYVIGRTAGLPKKLSILLACGNSICGNSAIAAIAPVIEADKRDVASAIAFTAIIGVGVVVGLPFLVHPLGLNFYQYGVLAGLTVYAVPQVLAAAYPVSAISGQIATLVKLVRVLMLGPVVVFFAVTHRDERGNAANGDGRFAVTRYVPWFILGFMGVAALRSFGVISTDGAAMLKIISTWLTLAAMAALGLGVDLSAAARVGRPVIITVCASLMALIALSVTLIRVLGIH